jgi:hypothetical protein
MLDFNEADRLRLSKTKVFHVFYKIIFFVQIAVSDSESDEDYKNVGEYQQYSKKAIPEISI